MFGLRAPMRLGSIAMQMKNIKNTIQYQPKFHYASQVEIQSLLSKSMINPNTLALTNLREILLRSKS